MSINSLSPGRYRFNLKWVIFLLKSKIDILHIFYKITLRSMPMGLTDD